MNKRRLGGPELEDRKKHKKAKTNNKEGHKENPSLSAKVDINHTRPLTRSELHNSKTPAKTEFQLLHKQKPTEVSRVRLTAVNHANQLQSNRVPYNLDHKHAKHEAVRGKGEQGTGTRRRKVLLDAKNDQGMLDKYLWTLTDAVGGQMLGLDPIFSHDEE